VLKVTLVLSFYQIKVLCERFFDCRGKHCVPILVALTSPDYYLVAGKVNVLDPEPQTFHQSQARSIEQHGHEPLSAIEDAEDRPDFLPCQHNR
jgi:hypothetical protein